MLLSSVVNAQAQQQGYDDYGDYGEYGGDYQDFGGGDDYGQEDNNMYAKYAQRQETKK